MSGIAVRGYVRSPAPAARSRPERLAERGRLATWRTAACAMPTGRRATPMADDEDGSGTGRSRTGVVIDTVTDVIVDAKGVVTPLSKSAAKELHKLEKRLAAARKTETKRLRQLASAQSSKGRKEIAKRSKQAAEAASEVASLASRIAGIATAAAGSAASSVGGAASSVGGAASSVGGAARGAVSSAAKGVGSAAAQAAQAVTPVKPPAAAEASKPATAAVKPAIATRKPAAKKPPAAKPSAKPVEIRHGREDDDDSQARHPKASRHDANTHGAAGAPAPRRSQRPRLRRNRPPRREGQPPRSPPRPRPASPRPRSPRPPKPAGDTSA